MHQLDALGGASGYPDLVHIRADDHAPRRDNHQIVIFVRDNAGCSNRPSSLGNMRSEDTATSSALGRIVFNGGALAIPMFGDHQNLAPALLYHVMPTSICALILLFALVN